MIRFRNTRLSHSFYPFFRGTLVVLRWFDHNLVTVLKMNYWTPLEPINSMFDGIKVVDTVVLVGAYLAIVTIATSRWLQFMVSHVPSSNSSLRGFQLKDRTKSFFCFHISNEITGS